MSIRELPTRGSHTCGPPSGRAIGRREATPRDGRLTRASGYARPRADDPLGLPAGGVLHFAHLHPFGLMNLSKYSLP